MNAYTDARIAALKAERTTVALEQKRLLDSIKPGDPRTPAQTAALNRQDAQIAEHDASIDALMAREDREAEAAKLRLQNAHAFGSSTSTSAFGASLRDAIGEVMDGRATAYVDAPRNVLTEATQAGDGVATQFMKPVSTMAAASVVMSLPGIRIDEMTTDRATYPRLGAATAAGIAEATALPAAATVTDSITVVAQKFASYEELSSELVEDYSTDALAAFGENLLKRLALRVDLGMLEGDGGNDVVGIRNVGGANTTSVAGLPTNFAKFREVELELRTADGDPRVWVMHPRTWSSLSAIKTGIASDETTLLEPNPQDGPRTLLGFPVHFSTQITLVEGAGAGSWAALVDTSQLLVCERRPARLEVSRDFKFSEDLVAVRATWRGGLGVMNATAISIAIDVRAS